MAKFVNCGAAGWLPVNRRCYCYLLSSRFYDHLRSCQYWCPRATVVVMAAVGRMAFSFTHVMKNSGGKRRRGEEKITVVLSCG